MTAAATNRWKHRIMSRAFAGGSALDAAVALIEVGSGQTLSGRITAGGGTFAGNVADYNVVSDLIGTVSGVSRVSGTTDQDLNGETSTEDDSGNDADVTATDVTFTAVTTGAFIGGYIIYEKGANDGARELLEVVSYAAAVPSNGGDITIDLSTGIAELD